jgi:hypothetical protein
VQQLIMGADVDGLIGAGRHERSGDRATWRNGYCLLAGYAVKYKVSKLCKDIGDRVHAFLKCPLTGEWPHI